MPVEAVVFDWGGTLTAGSSVISLELIDVWRVAARHLAPDREVELTEALLEAERQFWARTTTTLESGTLADLLRNASELLALDVTDALLEEAAAQHLDAWTPHIQHDPEAAAVLSELRSRGLRTALLSNTHWPRSFHEHFLERDGLVDLIDVRLYSSELHYMKPHPDAFAAALDAVGVTEPSHAVFVGDRPYDDIFGAQRAGLRTVLRPNAVVPPYDVVPDAVVQHLSDLFAVIDRF
jgi:putative hydrolase of the HAD superfamily